MFVEEYLQDLRRARFAPAAWWVYLRRVAQRGRANIVANPGAVRSVWAVALGYFALAFIASAILAMVDDRPIAYDFFALTSLTILPVFALVTLHLELLRDRDGYRLSALNLPTALTLLRVVLLPGILLFVTRGRLDLALAVFVAACLSDVADGWLARRWNQVTHLGTVLDPVVDILFSLVMFLGLAEARLIPGWVAAVAALRYGIQLVGGMWLYVFVGPVRIRPTFFGRLTGIVMSALVGFVVLLHSLSGRWAERLIPLTDIALGVLMCATVLYVVALGWYNLRVMTGKAGTERKVVDDVQWGAG
jgi:cardiolipin synthase (CMP-forming)